MGSSPTLAVRMLGEFQIHWGETPLAGALTPRLQSLLAYLFLHRDTALSRQQLAFHFWPDSSDRQARTNLRKALYRLRQALPALEAFVDLEGATLRWLPDARVWLDVAAFEEKLYEAETAAMQEQPALLAAAVALYRGSLLPDLYDDWVLPLREQLRQRYLGALELLAEQQEAKREYAAASQTARQMLREDPLRERGYRRLMRLQALSGDVAAALHTYHQCAVLLEQELGVEPAPATQAAYRQLVRQQGAAAEERARGAAALPLVGRHRSWQALLAAWRAVPPAVRRWCSSPARQVLARRGWQRSCWPGRAAGHSCPQRRLFCDGGAAAAGAGRRLAARRSSAAGASLVGATLAARAGARAAGAVGNRSRTGDARPMTDPGNSSISLWLWRKR
jgi:DNA-binding SARP family transcriptional activator